ncbi:WD repeat domain phosphoinositide-interacting protein 2 isoform X2 [Parasteatoda tepidariorum]|uniref:WD repeat domain phosphoinositide-interacting protein 2 isoform X2 n=1 Tax=Parasteatoda tepidariorum TaxID=114398 RepID=UPI00077FE2DF|nr:WD repeat domain phosphoinositide-interacting protein 2 isoform X2 [Parasteatoda tepidariorum]
MNLIESTDEASGEVLFVNFNQDCTSLAVGTKNGFKLYAFNSVDNLEIIHESQEPAEDIRIIERLFSSSLVALVTNCAPRKLKVCHFKKCSEICNYSYSNTILAVKLNRQRLVVCLEESLYIHNIRDMKVLHTIKDTPPNPSGLCVLSVCNENNYLAYPGSSSIGEVQIFDALNLQAKSMIPAHDNPLAAMAFDPTGTKLATASEKGTVIRVFNVLDGSKLYEFRRGMKRCVRIYSLSFSEDSKYLSASSNTDTVHIFRLEELKDVKPSEDPQSWLGLFGKAIISSASYLPTQVADMLYQERSFANVHLPFFGVRNICTLATIEKIQRVLVVSGEGKLYIYDLEPIEGGDCTFVVSHNLINLTEKSVIMKPGESSTENSPPAALPDSPSVRRPFQPGSTSYAAIVRGGDTGTAQETDQESHKDAHYAHCAKDLYENEFPPMNHKNEM